MSQIINIIRADITTLKVDAIVNAANSLLLGGGGVDGAIHRAAGHELYDECAALPLGPNGRCPVGEARITGAYKLPCLKIIHTVGPVYKDGFSGEERMLASCYIKSLECARAHGLSVIAFPNISTGVYGYPKPDAAQVAISAVRSFVSSFPVVSKVIFVCYDKENFDIYKKMALD